MNQIMPAERQNWKDYSKYYSVSTLGLIYSKRHRKVMKQRICPKTGYLYVVISDRYKRTLKRVHNLVAQTFLGERPFGLEIDHIDGNKTNNNIRNLRYVTKSENAINSIRNGNWPNNSNENHGAHKLKNFEVELIRKLWATGNYFQRTLAQMFRVKQSHISDIVNHKKRKASYAQCKSNSNCN